MSDVAVIGLGSMGIAMTKVLLAQDYQVTVWNRNMQKADVLTDAGASIAKDVASAILSSPLLLVCVSDYKATYEIFDDSETATLLSGRTMVQLSTGTPLEARQAQQWAEAYHLDYLDGAILAVPSQLGGPESTIFLSGANTAYATSESILRVLAGNVTYLGEAVGAASAFDLGFLSFLSGSLLGFYHAALVFEAEGLRIDSLGAMLAETAPAIGEMLRYDGEVIQSSTYSNPESTLKTTAIVVEMILRQAQEARINTIFPLFAVSLFRKALAEGFENEEVASIVKILRAG